MALSLRTLARLEVPAIARAFLVPEATMAKRLVRARAKIATARIPYAIPADTELPGRLASVLAVVYLAATEAHAPTGGDAVARVDLEAEAIRLARLLAGLMPDEPEALSLLALLLLTSARTSARTDAGGNPVTLADQDRTRWNRAAIAEGSAWLSEAVARSGGVAGPYQIQAHLAAAHSTAPSWQETDWDRIVGLYDLLGSITASPVVALNRAVAVTERDGPEAGLAALKTRVSAVRVETALRRAGRQRRVVTRAAGIVTALRTPQLRQEPVVERAMRTEILALRGVLDAVCESAVQLAAALAEAFRQHPDYEIITSFPGLADVSGAIVLAEIGDDRDRFSDDRALQAFAGSAPVTRASGKSRTVTRRRTKNNRLAAIGYSWAFTAASRPSPAREHYLRRRDRGDGHPAALRHLFNRMLGQLHHCLRTSQPYDSARAFPHPTPEHAEPAAA